MPQTIEVFNHKVLEYSAIGVWRVRSCEGWPFAEVGEKARGGRLSALTMLNERYFAFGIFLIARPDIEEVSLRRAEAAGMNRQEMKCDGISKVIAIFFLFTPTRWP